jgi:hypothetical protein
MIWRGSYLTFFSRCKAPVSGLRYSQIPLGPMQIESLMSAFPEFGGKGDR